MRLCNRRTSFKIGSEIEVGAFFRKKNKNRTVCYIEVASHKVHTLKGTSVCSPLDTFDEKLGKELALDCALDKHYMKVVKQIIFLVKTEMRVIAFLANTVTHRFGLKSVDVLAMNWYFLKQLHRAIDLLMEDIEKKQAK